MYCFLKTYVAILKNLQVFSLFTSLLVVIEILFIFPSLNLDLLMEGGGENNSRKLLNFLCDFSLIQKMIQGGLIKA